MSDKKRKEKTIKPESDQASRSNYQFTINKRTEEYVNNPWGCNHQNLYGTNYLVSSENKIQEGKYKKVRETWRENL